MCLYLSWINCCFYTVCTVHWHFSYMNQFFAVSHDIRLTSFTTSNWSHCTLYDMWPDALTGYWLFMLNKAINGVSWIYWVLLWVNVSLKKPWATKSKEKASSAVFWFWLEDERCMLHPVHTHTHTHILYIQRQLIHKRQISHLGHFLLPRSLWERSCSQILIPLVWSQRKCSVLRND